MLSNKRQIECVIFDFGNTLVDEQWMLQSPADLPTWELAYRHGVWNRPKEFGEPWSRGELSGFDIAERMHNVLGIPVNRAYQIMMANSRKIRFFPNIMQFVQQRRKQGLKQAILTINPDMFWDVIVPHYQLDNQFDIIVNSSDHGTLDKAELSQHIFAHFDWQIGFNNSLLIDNTQHHLDSFAAQGGATYLFTTDIQFQDDLHKGELAFLQRQSKGQA